MTLVSEAGSMRSPERSSARTWSLVTSMVTQARAAIAGAGTEDNRPTVDIGGADGVAAEVVAGGAAAARAEEGTAAGNARKQAEATVASANRRPGPNEKKRSFMWEDGRARGACRRAGPGGAAWRAPRDAGWKT